MKFALSAVPALALGGCANPDTPSVVMLDEADSTYMSRSLQGALESNKSGHSSNWINPDNSHRGAVTPLRTFKSETGQDCREFQRLATIEGKTGFNYGTACRQPDGTWRIVTDTRKSYDNDPGPRYGGYVGYGHYGYPYSYRHSYGYRHYLHGGRHYGSGISFGFGYP